MSKYFFKMIFIKALVSIAYLINMLITKSLGILLLSIALYYFSPCLGLGKPYSFSELMLWLNELPENSKTTIFTSIITISGFLIAFSINSSSQKQQLMAQMRMEASNDIEVFFNHASKNLTSTNIYAKYLIKVLNYINNEADENTINFHLHNVIIETEKYIILRKTLQEQSIEVHRFQGKYSLIFASSWGVTRKLEKATHAYNEVIDKIWFNTPIINLNDPDIKSKYIAHVNVEKCKKFINAYEKNFDIINESIGGLRGSMLGTITGLNLSFLINLLKMANK